MVKAAGSAAKLSPGLLDSVLRRLPRPTDPNVLVGFHTNDDAGVYLLSDGLALVQTVDFFTPIVDDPFTFGQIAAANALSDVYAMGGKPVSALSIVGFPDKGDAEILEQIIRGGLSKMTEAKCSVIGGHSIRTGVLSTALKKDRAAPAALQAAVTSMTELNRAASEALQEIQEKAGSASPVHAVTDITGFGLLGHAREMALGDAERGIESVSLEIDHSAIRYLPGAFEAAREGFLPDGLKNNRDFVGDCVNFAEDVPQEFRDLLFDPQTSGGLLMSISPQFADAAIATLNQHGVSARRVGHVVAKKNPLLFVQ